MRASSRIDQNPPHGHQTEIRRTGLRVRRRAAYSLGIEGRSVPGPRNLVARASVAASEFRTEPVQHERFGQTDPDSADIAGYLNRPLATLSGRSLQATATARMPLSAPCPGQVQTAQEGATKVDLCLSAEIPQTAAWLGSCPHWTRFAVAQAGERGGSGLAVAGSWRMSGQSATPRNKGIS